MSGRTVILIVLAVIVVLAAGFAALLFVAWSVSGPPSIAEGTVLEVPLAGSIAEVPSGHPLLQIVQARSATLFELREALEHAARDERIRGLYIEIRPLSMSFAQIEELRDYIKHFRKSGKPVEAFIAVEAAQEGEIYLASAADSVTLNPGTGLLVNGLLAEVTFYRATLDKLRIKPEFIEFKEYKNPGTYTRQEMTPEYRGMLESVIRDMEERFVNTVCSDRKIHPERLRELMALGLISEETAVREKIVDAVGYKHQVRDRMSFAGGDRKTYKGMEFNRYLDAVQSRLPIPSRNKVAYVTVEGAITSGNSEPFAEIVGGSTLAGLLRELREDKSVKGVLLRVNSPGGSVVGSEMVWEEVKMLGQAGKPVIVSMSGVAASGGYYVSMNAREIVSQPSTITGSIGVIFGKVDLSGFYNWLGMSVEQVKISPNADIFSLNGALSEDQRRQLEGWMGDVYESFVSKAAKARKMGYDVMEKKAHGRIYTGVQAKAAGLVDHIGGAQQAVEQMRRALKLGKDEPVSLVIYPRPKTVWESLASGDLLPVKAPPAGLRGWLEAEAAVLSTPAPWAILRDIRIH